MFASELWIESLENYCGCHQDADWHKNAGLKFLFWSLSRRRLGENVTRSIWHSPSHHTNKGEEWVKGVDIFRTKRTKQRINNVFYPFLPLFFGWDIEESIPSLSHAWLPTESSDKTFLFSSFPFNCVLQPSLGRGLIDLFLASVS